jgi:hypothetical protein
MNESNKFRKFAPAAIIFALLALASAGCGASHPADNAYTAAPAVAAQPAAAPAASTDSAQGKKPESGMVGVYEGTTRAYCIHTIPSRCNAVQDVTITLTEQENSKIGGSYRCAYGNMVCYNLNETGKVIDASVNGARLNVRVLMPDGTSCIFTGLNNAGNINGGYTCYAGGALLEQGMWRAKQKY